MTNRSKKLNAAPPRLVPGRPFPPYAYRPGKPHPTRDPEGHSFEAEEPLVPCPDPDQWQDCEDYLYGIDLFNAGYFWEAHEAWEGLWNACEREGPVADLMKALIALAAALQKSAAGNDTGVSKHAARAQAILKDLTPQVGVFMGLDLDDLMEQASRLAAQPDHRPFLAPRT